MRPWPREILAGQPARSGNFPSRTFLVTLAFSARAVIRPRPRWSWYPRELSGADAEPAARQLRCRDLIRSPGSG